MPWMKCPATWHMVLQIQAAADQLGASSVKEVDAISRIADSSGKIVMRSYRHFYAYSGERCHLLISFTHLFNNKVAVLSTDKTYKGGNSIVGNNKNEN